MTARWWKPTASLSFLLLLLLTAASVTTPLPDGSTTPPTEAGETTVDTITTTTVQPPLPPQPPVAAPRRTAKVTVVDATKNSSSVVSIELPTQPADANLTVAELQQLKVARSLGCLAQHRANVFLLVHLNRNWRHKLDFALRLLRHAHNAADNSATVVVFNEFTRIFASFGTEALTSRLDLPAALAELRAAMQRDEAAAASEHWPVFRLDDALKATFRYARRFLRPLSLDARPSVLISYFDDGAAIDEATLEEAGKFMLQQMGSDDPLFAARVSLLQWPDNLPVPDRWTRAAELLASDPSYQATAATEDELLNQTAQLAGDICQKIRPE